jgi:hypothetical protein
MALNGSNPRRKHCGCIDWCYRGDHAPSDRRRLAASEISRDDIDEALEREHWTRADETEQSLFEAVAEYRAERKAVKE